MARGPRPARFLTGARICRDSPRCPFNLKGLLPIRYADNAVPSISQPWKSPLRSWRRVRVPRPVVFCTRIFASLLRVAWQRGMDIHSNSTCQKWPSSSPITATSIGQYIIQDRSSHLLRGGPIMTFDELLAQVLDLLQREGRVSYRALKR